MMINLADRPLIKFNKGELIRLVDDSGISGFRRRQGFTSGNTFVVHESWAKFNKKRDKLKIFVKVSGYDFIFSTRRFERVNHFNEDLFTL